jgi:co-chaperonin GroES (HSP10)
MKEIPDVWPEGPKILIEVDRAESVSSGGIFIPETSRVAEQMRLTQGTVLRIGPTAQVDVAGGFDPGTRIIFAKYGGFRLQGFEDRSRDFRIINDEDVLAVIGEEDG